MKRALPWLAVLVAAGCSTSPSSPTAASAPASTGNARAIVSGLTVGAPSSEAPVRTQAAGDVQNGPLEILRVRVRQASAGFYALPGGSYQVTTGVPVELWIEWSPTSPVSTVPRLIVDWSPTAKENIHCGPCLLTNTYNQAGSYSVTVTLDDRVGGVTKRTFTFNVGAPKNGPEITRVSEVADEFGWRTTYRIAYDLGVTISIRSIKWWRADTRTQIGANGDATLGHLDASQLPFLLPLGGSLDCGDTGGAQGYFTWNFEVVGDDGLVTVKSVESIPFPCSQDNS